MFSYFLVIKLSCLGDADKANNKILKNALRIRKCIYATCSILHHKNTSAGKNILIIRLNNLVVRIFKRQGKEDQ